MAELKRSDFSKICRTCLLQKENMEPIYKSDIPKMLLSFTNIKVQTEDEFPKIICADCADQVYKCYLFKQQCEENQCLLEKILHENSIDIEQTVLDSPNSGSVFKQVMLKAELNEESKSKTEISDRTDSNEHNKDNFFDTEEFHVNENKITKDIVHNFHCEQCGKSFGRKDYLVRHKKRHSTKDLVKEKQNCAVTVEGVLLKTEIPEIESKTEVNCTNESTESPDGDDYFNDENFHGSEKSVTITKNNFECAQCGKTFSRKDYLNKHVKRHLPKDIVKEKQTCPICSKAIINLKFHTKMNHSLVKPFKCSECDASFALNCFLDKHIRFQHRGEKRKKTERKLCTICGKVFSERGYKYHMLRHSGEKPYICSHCHIAFRSINVLKCHERRHTNERPYKCTYCAEAFRSKNVLSRHTRIHTGEKPFVCRICNKAFRQKVTLTTHMKIH